MPEAVVELWGLLAEAAAGWSPWEFAAVGLAVAYLLLAAREHVACWPAALASTAIYFVLLARAGLVFQTGLQLFYMAMAVYGWWHWRHPGRRRERLPISTWPLRTHLVLIAGVGLVSLATGWLLARSGGTAMPYLDAATTWFAVAATFMVAQKKLENWLYWVVIDAASLVLFAAQGLVLTAALMGLYTLLAAYAGSRWWIRFRRQLPVAACPT